MDNFEHAFMKYYEVCSKDKSMTIIKKRIWWNITNNESESTFFFRKVRTDNGEIYSKFGSTAIGNVYDFPNTSLNSSKDARKEKRSNQWIKQPSIPIPDNSNFDTNFKSFVNFIQNIYGAIEIKKGKVWIQIMCNKQIGTFILKIKYARIRSDTGEIFSRAGNKPLGSVYSNDFNEVIKKIEKKLRKTSND